MELKRLYVQIQMYKSRAAAARKDTSTRASKRRVISRKHTSSHRRFSLQTLQGKIRPPVTGDGASSCGNASPGVEQGATHPALAPEGVSASRTPEESINSAIASGQPTGGEKGSTSPVTREES